MNLKEVKKQHWQSLNLWGKVEWVFLDIVMFPSFWREERRIKKLIKKSNK